MITRIDPPGIAYCYDAAWTATSNSAYGSAMTGTVTLPHGSYLIRGVQPNINTSGFWTELTAVDTASTAYTFHNNPLGYHPGSCTEHLWLVEVTGATASFRLASAASDSRTFSYTERGGLFAIRLDI